MNGEIIAKIFGIIGATVVSLLLLFIGFSFYRQSKSVTDTASNTISGFTTTMTESQYTQYANQTVLGSQVISQCNEFLNTDVAVEVVLGTGTTVWFNYSTEDMGGTALTKTENETAMASITDRSQGSYINPNGKFLCTIIRNGADTITCVKFEQQ